MIPVSWLFRRVVAGRDSDILTMRVLSIMPYIPKNLVRSQMERSHFQSVSFNRNILAHLWRWSTHFGQNILTKICLSIFSQNSSFPQFSLHLCKEFREGIKKWYRPFLLVGPVGSENVVPFSLGSHWSLTSWFGIMESTLPLLFTETEVQINIL